MVKALSLALLLPALLVGGIPAIVRPVTDTRGLLSAADTEAVADGLVRLRKETGTQMAVLIVGTTGGVPIEDYAEQAAHAWRGGEAGRDNGLLLVVAVDDRRMRLEVGYGLEEYVPDDVARRLLDAQGPLMRARDYRGALLSIILGVRQRLPGDAPVSTDWLPWGPEQVGKAFMWMMWSALAAAMLMAGCLGRWNASLGPGRVKAAVVALAVVPLATVAFAVQDSQIPTAFFLATYLTLFTLFLVGGLSFRHVSARLGGVIVVSTVLGSGIAWGMHSSGSLLALLQQALLLSGGVAVACAFFLAFFASASSGSTFGSSSTSDSVWFASSSSSSSSSSSDSSWFSSSSSSDSSWGSSSSDSSWSSSSDSSSSSSDSSWGGGGGDFGGGGASSSW